MVARALRAVPPVEEPVRVKSVTEAASSGSHRDLLVAMRARIARAVEDEDTPARDLAALTKRLADVARDIEAIDARAEQEGGGSSGVVPDEPFSSSAI